MKNVSETPCRQNQNTHFMFKKILLKIVSFSRQCGKLLYSRTGHRWQNGGCALHAGHLTLQTLTHNM